MENERTRIGKRRLYLRISASVTLKWENMVVAVPCKVLEVRVGRFSTMQAVRPQETGRHLQQSLAVLYMVYLLTAEVHSSLQAHPSFQSVCFFSGICRA